MIKFTLIARRPALIKLASLEERLKRAGVRSLGVDFRFKQDAYRNAGTHFLVLHIRLDD